MLRLTAAGEPSDYDESLRSTIRQRLATAAGVDVSRVELTILAASVRIVAVISSSPAADSQTIVASLDRELGSVAEATAALGIQVVSEPQIEETTEHEAQTAVTMARQAGAMIEGEPAALTASDNEGELTWYALPCGCIRPLVRECW